MGKRLAIGALFGAAVGVVAGILTAPKSGKETRQDIKDKAEDLKDKAVQKKDEAMERAEELVGDVKARATGTPRNPKG
jgi:gas vesicle protein